MMHQQQDRPLNAGFTLLEMMIAVVVMMILMGLLMGAVSGIRERARIKQAEAEVKTMALAVRAYKTEFSYWPLPLAAAGVGGTWSNNNNLVFWQLVKSVNGRRNYLEQTDLNTAVKDIFGANYFVVTIDVANDSVQVQSSGPDARYGTGDDISSGSL